MKVKTFRDFRCNIKMAHKQVWGKMPIRIYAYWISNSAIVKYCLSLKIDIPLSRYLIQNSNSELMLTEVVLLVKTNLLFNLLSWSCLVVGDCKGSWTAIWCQSLSLTWIHLFVVQDDNCASIFQCYFPLATKHNIFIFF